MKNLSVIVPTYNNANYLEQCIDSIINQGDYIKEVIIINDGSTDNTSEVLINLKKKSPKLKIINTDNRGVSHARNVGIEKASGDYITFVDSDDYIERGTFDNINKKVLTDIDTIRYNFTEFGGRRYSNNLHELKDSIINTDKDKENLRKHLLTSSNPIPNLCQLLIIKKAIAKQNHFNEQIHFLEDAIYYQDIIRDSQKIAIIDEKGYNLRTTDTSSSRSSSRTILNLESLAKANKELCRIAPELEDYINDNNLKLFIDKLSRNNPKELRSSLRLTLDNCDIAQFLVRINRDKISLTNRILLKSILGRKIYILLYLKAKSYGRIIKRRLV